VKNAKRANKATPNDSSTVGGRREFKKGPKAKQTIFEGLGEEGSEVEVEGGRVEEEGVGDNIEDMGEESGNSEVETEEEEEEVGGKELVDEEVNNFIEEAIEEGTAAGVAMQPLKKLRRS
jgi:hypothetical protein